MNVRATVSLSAIAAVLVLGVVYMAVGVLHLDPRRSYITADMQLDNSGGLGANSPVLLDGVQVGRTQDVSKQATGVRVRLRIDDRYHIPEASSVHIEQLSALGEPYIEFSPTTGAGPYLHNGEVLAADRIHMPMTITALSARLVQLLDQLHPQAISQLVGTFGTALSGTDTAVQTLAHSTDLLAATLLSRTDAVRRLFGNMQAMGGNMAWMGPSLTTAGPQLGLFGTSLTHIVESGSVLSGKRPVADYFTGTGVTPFLKNLTALLQKIGPGIAPLAPVLQPVVSNAAAHAPRIDISALIGQALQGVSPDGTLNFRVALK